METIEYRDAVDKSGWPSGPWQSEPDKKQWEDPATGMPCLIVRGPAGALCGYVGVALGHPCFGRDYCHEAVTALEVHGGITFGNRCQPNAPEARGICHKVGKGENDEVWWLGFDCAHLHDLCPMIELLHWRGLHGQRQRDETYKDWAYVTREVEKLAQQLAKVA
jgi:hypothetical protein